jgi:hypothetical protein
MPPRQKRGPLQRLEYPLDPLARVNFPDDPIEELNTLVRATAEAVKKRRAEVLGEDMQPVRRQADAARAWSDAKFYTVLGLRCGQPVPGLHRLHQS